MTYHPATVQVAPPTASTPQRKRLATLDLMRGYYVGVLAAIHLDYVPSLLGLVDGRGSLLVSEAEGFFMISGLLVGMLRRRDLERVRPAADDAQLVEARGLQLYIVAVPLTLLFTLHRSGRRGARPQPGQGRPDHTSSTAVPCSSSNAADVPLHLRLGRLPDLLRADVPGRAAGRVAALEAAVAAGARRSPTSATGCPRTTTRASTARSCSGACTSSSARRPATTGTICAADGAAVKPGLEPGDPHRVHRRRPPA
jgi:hypothetical protein